MAKTKITALTELTDTNIAIGDLIPIVDISDTSQAASGTTKKVTITSLATAVASAFSGDSPTFVNLTTTGTTTLGDSGDATTVNGTLGVTGNLTVDTNTLFVDAALDRVGIGNTAPDNALHIFRGSAGTVTSNAGSTLTLEHNSTNYLQFLTPNTNTQGILFGDPESTNATYLNYDHNVELMDIQINGTDTVNIVAGKFGINRLPTTLALEVNGDASKTSSGNWNTNSDERLKTNIELADLKKCTELLKSIPLKRFTWKDDSLTIEQAKDRSKLGWIAQEVKQYLPKAVIEQSFSKIKIEDGFELVEEDVFIETEKEIENKEIKLVGGKYKEVITKKVQKNKEQVFDEFDLFDEAGEIIGRHKVAKKQTVSKPKFKQDVIEDCLSLNADQIYAAMYGAVQLLIQKVELLEAK